jgi:hypothetical protein
LLGDGLVVSFMGERHMGNQGTGDVGWRAAAIIVVGGVLLAGCSGGSAATAPAASDHVPSGLYDAVKQDPNLYNGRLNPNTLIGLSAEQLRKTMQISVQEAPTPEEFAKAYVQRFELWLNAGSTLQELTEYENDPSAYLPAMAQQYDGPFSEGLFGANVDKIDRVQAMAKIHRVCLQNFRTKVSMGSPNESATITYKGATVVQTYSGGGEVVNVATHAHFNVSDNSANVDRDGTTSLIMADVNGDGVYDVYVLESDMIVAK